MFSGPGAQYAAAAGSNLLLNRAAYGYNEPTDEVQRPWAGAFPDGLDQAEALRRFHSFYGHPDEIIERLRKEKVLPVATDLITQFNPAVPDHDAAIRALELIATEVAPALGWKPATQDAAAPELTGA